MLTTYHHPVPLSRNLGTLTSWNPLGLSRPVMGLVYFTLLCLNWQHIPVCIRNVRLFLMAFQILVYILCCLLQRVYVPIAHTYVCIYMCVRVCVCLRALVCVCVCMCRCVCFCK